VRVRLAGICRTDLEVLRGYHKFRGIPGTNLWGKWWGRRTPPWWDNGWWGRSTFPVASAFPLPPGPGPALPGTPGFGFAGEGRRLCGIPHPAAREPASGAAGLADEAAVFTEPLAAALAVSEAAPAPLEQRVLVVGDGTLGLLISFTLALRGLETHLVGHYGNICSWPSGME
jgi:alcohol dehydrogenase